MMNNVDTREDIKKLLEEIRDNQKRALAYQEEQVALTRQRLETANKQIESSIELQKEAVQRQKNIMKAGLPLIVLCIVLIIYLIARYL